jgi:hypothetical protein
MVVIDLGKWKEGQVDLGCVFYEHIDLHEGMISLFLLLSRKEFRLGHDDNFSLNVRQCFWDKWGWHGFLFLA